MGYSYYQLVLGWNLIGFVCNQLSSYTGLVVYKPYEQFIIVVLSTYVVEKVGSYWDNLL